MSDLLQVRSQRTDGRVVLWERDEAHPSGEVFIVANGRPFQVAPTERIAELLRDGTLVVVEVEPAEDLAPAEETPPPNPITDPAPPVVAPPVNPVVAPAPAVPHRPRANARKRPA